MTTHNEIVEGLRKATYSQPTFVAQPQEQLEVLANYVEGLLADEERRYRKRISNFMQEFSAALNSWWSGASGMDNAALRTRWLWLRDREEADLDNYEHKVSPRLIDLAKEAAGIALEDAAAALKEGNVELEKATKLITRLKDMIVDTVQWLDPECPDSGAYVDGHCSLEQCAKRIVESRDKVQELLTATTTRLTHMLNAVGYDEQEQLLIGPMLEYEKQPGVQRYDTTLQVMLDYIGRVRESYRVATTPGLLDRCTAEIRKFYAKPPKPVPSCGISGCVCQGEKSGCPAYEPDGKGGFRKKSDLKRRLDEVQAAVLELDERCPGMRVSVEIRADYGVKK